MPRKEVCIWLDGGATKVYHQFKRLKRYLRRFGIKLRVICKTNLHDAIIDEFAKKANCVLVTTDEYYKFKEAKVIKLSDRLVKTKSKRDLALKILKAVISSTK